MSWRDRKTVLLPGIKSTLDIQHPVGSLNTSYTNTSTILCRPDAESEAVIILCLSSLGIFANCTLMALIVIRNQMRKFPKPLKWWNQGLVFHQGLVDLLRSLLLMPLALSILYCQPLTSCSVLETSFLVLVTASTINLLTTVMNDAPVLPEEDDEDAIPMLMDSPQCVWFGIFVIWFASITLNLGPTFLSGTMAANVNHRPREPSCPLVQGPYRHYILNFLWIFINLMCILLTVYHLVKLYRDYSTTSADAVRVATLVTSLVTIDGEGSEISDIPSDSKLMPRESILDWQSQLTVLAADPVKVKLYLSRVEREGIARVKMLFVITLAYLIFWGPLFLVTLLNWDWEFEDAKQSMAHEVTLHVAFVHSFVNPSLFMVLHRGIRQTTMELLCCSCISVCKRPGRTGHQARRNGGDTVTASENRAFLKAGNSGSPEVPGENQDMATTVIK